MDKYTQTAYIKQIEIKIKLRLKQESGFKLIVQNTYIHVPLTIQSVAVWLINPTLLWHLPTEVEWDTGRAET